MLFMATYKPRGEMTEATQKRSLQLFTNWKPPAGFEFKAHYAAADGSGYALVEVDSPAAAVEGISPWEPFFEFSLTPVLEMAQAVPILQRVYAWRDSVR